MTTRATVKQKTPATPTTPAGERLSGWLGGHARLLFWALILIGTARIVATYSVFNHTIDEPAHIACGMEWLDKGRYAYEPQHPPLARVATAIGPYLAGRRTVGRPQMYQEGVAILYRDGNYDRNLTLARLGILPFFWLGCAVMFLWGKRAMGPAGGVLALLIFSFLPPVLAHAGLATTDMALTATLGAAFLMTLVFLEKPSWANAALLGVAVAAAVLSKLSVLAFYPMGCAAALVWHWWSARPTVAELGRATLKRLPGLALAAVVVIVTVWAGYRFSYGPAGSLGINAPAPELFRGIDEVREHNRGGHPAYLLGERSMYGWWYYYPVVLAVKTPLAMLALSAAGLWLMFKRRQAQVGLAAAFAAGILVFSLFTSINIGVRHILPVYFGFAILAAYAVVEWLPSVWGMRATVAALLLLVVSSVASHPDYLPYFNLIAGDEPEKILVDSDLDWGQDMKRLAQRLQEVGAREVAFNPFIIAYLEAAHGFPPIRETNPVVPAPGWNAVSLTVLKTARLGLYDEHPEVRLWPDVIKPTERVGKSTLLYYIPRAQTPRN
jgi:hypothetical protein